MTTTQLYLSKIVFKNLHAPKDYLQFSYCIEASTYKFAYQKALILASNKFQELNDTGVYQYVGLQELSQLNKLPTLQNISDALILTDLNEYDLKVYNNSLIELLSEVTV